MDVCAWHKSRKSTFAEWDRGVETGSAGIFRAIWFGSASCPACETVVALEKRKLEMDAALLLESVRWEHLLVSGACMVTFALIHWLVLKPWERRLRMDQERRLERTQLLMLDTRLESLTSDFLLKAAEDGGSVLPLTSQLNEIRSLVERVAPHEHTQKALLHFISCSEDFLKARMAHASATSAQAELNALMLAHQRLSSERGTAFGLAHSRLRG